MSTIMPQGELMRRAVAWIDEQRAETGKSLAELLDMAALRFNLSPNDATFLENFFREQRDIPRD